MKDFKIMLRTAPVMGNSLHLQILDKTLSYNLWSIEDEFNGKEELTSIDEPIYGFYIPGTHVNLYLANSDTGQETVFRNVRLYGGEI